MMKVIPLVFTQRMYKSKVETKFLFYNPLHIRRDLLGFSRVLKMQDTSHQNKQCCNKCGMRRIPKKISKYSRTDGKYNQNHFCHESF